MLINAKFFPAMVLQGMQVPEFGKIKWEDQVGIISKAVCLMCWKCNTGIISLSHDNM